MRGEKVGKLIDDFIAKSGLRNDILTAGLEFHVGVAGARLTSIQRQKLTIARALIKNPEILVINDALALFDNRSAELMIDGILKLMKGTTVIWIVSGAERLEAFDRIIVMDKGKVRVEGPSADILEQPDTLAFLN